MAKRTIDELVTAVANRDHIAKADIEDEIKEWLNEAYMEIAEKVPSLFEKTATFDLSSGSHDYTISDQISDFNELLGLDSDYGPIVPQDPKRARLKLYSDIAGDGIDYLSETDERAYPKVCWVIGDTLYVYPVPDSNYALTMYYTYTPDFVTAGYFDVPAANERLLITYAKAILDEREREWDSADSKRRKSLWSNDYET